MLVPRLNEKDLVGELMFDKLGRSGAHQVGTYLRESNRIDLNRAVQVLGLRLKNLWIDKNRRKRPELVGNTHDLPEVVDEREEPLVAEVITDAMLDSRNEIGNLLRDLLEEVINDGYEEDRRKRAKPVMRSFMAGLKRGELPRCSDLADQYAMSRTAVYKHHFTQTLCAFVHRLSEDADLRARVQDLLIERGCPREQAQRWLYPVVWSGWMRFFVTERDPENGDKIGPKPAYRY